MITHPTVKTRVDLAKHFGELGFKVGAEIGVCKGKMSRVFCWYVPDLYLAGIDTWTSDPNDPGDEGELNSSNERHARRILSPFHVTLLKCTSRDALKYFDDGILDFVYIDANHTFDYVMFDIIEWSRKVKIGGIISGHDYYRIKNFNVILAVDTYLKAHPELTGYITSDDHTPSWWWTKV